MENTEDVKVSLSFITPNFFSFLLRRTTETDTPVLRLCARRHTESVLVELINGNLLSYTSGI